MGLGVARGEKEQGLHSGVSGQDVRDRGKIGSVGKADASPNMIPTSSFYLDPLKQIIAPSFQLLCRRSLSRKLVIFVQPCPTVDGRYLDAVDRKRAVVIGGEVKHIIAVKGGLKVSAHA
jgi:hypothetical protein